MAPVIVVALLAPFVGAVLVLVIDRARVRGVVASLSLAVAALFLTVGALRPAASGPWAPDRVGWLLAMASLFIGVNVSHFAVRQFAYEGRGRTILAASLATIGAVVAADVARTPTSLLVSWLATSTMTVVLLRASDPSRGPHSSAHRAVRAFVVGDVVLVGSFAVAVAVVGFAPFTAPFGAHLHGSAADVLIAAGTFTATVRAGLTVRRSWVTATINAPTSTSALLHAGVVNGGALLLWRLHELAGSPAVVSYALAIVCVAVIVTLAPRIHQRVDLKGQLAASTVSQMAFMFLALALGLPLLAISHLIGHGIYKASRFMSAGGAIEQRARLRRRAPRGRALTRGIRSVGAVALLLVAAGMSGAIPTDGAAAMAVFGPAAAVVWWTRSAAPVRGPGATWLVLAATLAAYAGLLSLMGQFVEPSYAFSGVRGPWWTLGALTLAVTALTALRRRTELRRPRASTDTQISEDLAMEELAA